MRRTRSAQHAARRDVARPASTVLPARPPVAAHHAAAPTARRALALALAPLTALAGLAVLPALRDASGHGAHGHGHGHEGHWVQTGSDMVVLQQPAGTGADASRLRPVAAATTAYDGFSTFSIAQRGQAAYVLRLVSSPGAESLRPYLVEAAERATAAGGARFSVASGSITDRAPRTGEILVKANDDSECPGAMGCGGPVTDGDGTVLAGRVWVAPAAMSFEGPTMSHLVEHELGHAIGLAHHDTAQADGFQVMHSEYWEADHYRAGDLRGVKKLGPASTGYDLAVSGLTVTPLSPVEGAGVRFSATMRNVGTAPTPSGVVHDLVFQVGGTPVTWNASRTASLAAGQAVTLSAVSGGSAGAWVAQQGSHLVTAVVDSANRLPAELDEAANAVSAPLQVAAAGAPDLVVTSVSSTPHPVADGELTRFVATFRNTGTAPVPSGVLQDVTFLVDGVPVASSTASTAALPVGGSVTVSAAYGGEDGAWRAVAGQHTLTAVVDRGAFVTESDESNNARTTTLSVASAPAEAAPAEDTSGGSTSEGTGTVVVTSPSPAPAPSDPGAGSGTGTGTGSGTGGPVAGPGVHQETSSLIGWTGTWASQAKSGDSGGAVRYANTAPASASITFEGTGITWLSRRNAYSGINRVLLDGVEIGEVDRYAVIPQYQVRAWTSPELAPGVHTLTVEHTGRAVDGAKDDGLMVDAFVVRGAGDLAAGPGAYQETAPELSYSGDWLTHRDGRDAAGAVRYALDGPASVTLEFTGTGVTWVSRKTSHSGVNRVYVDGRLVATIDRYAANPLYGLAVWKSPTLPRGTHTVRIEHTGRKHSSARDDQVMLDSFVVR